jgi:hypothetical protein
LWQWLLVPYFCFRRLGTVDVVTSFAIKSHTTSTTATSTCSLSTSTSTALKSTSTGNNNVNARNNVFPISTRQLLIERSKQINRIVPPQQSATATATATAATAATAAATANTNAYTYTTSASWSNRAATILTPVHVEPVGVYTADRPFYWNRIDVGCRATIIEMPTESSSLSSLSPSNENTKPDLFIHSPVQLDGPMIQCLQQIGNVRYICSTNYEYVKYASMWYQNYGSPTTATATATATATITTTTATADMWACPGLSERMPEIPWKGEIPNGYRPVSWQDTDSTEEQQQQQQQQQRSVSKDPLGIWDTSILQPFHINMEHNPFTQRPFFNEVIYYHVPTKTLLCTDLFWNYPSADGVPNAQYGQNDTWELAPKIQPIPLGSQLWKFSMDQIYYPFFHNCMITNRKEYEKLAHHILHVWDVETIIPAHGDIIRGKPLIQSILTKYFQI